MATYHDLMPSKQLSAVSDRMQPKNQPSEAPILGDQRSRRNPFTFIRHKRRSDLPQIHDIWVIAYNIGKREFASYKRNRRSITVQHSRCAKTQILKNKVAKRSTSSVVSNKEKAISVSILERSKAKEIRIPTPTRPEQNPRYLRNPSPQSLRIIRSFHPQKAKQPVIILNNISYRIPDIEGLPNADNRHIDNPNKGTLYWKQ